MTMTIPDQPSAGISAAPYIQLTQRPHRPLMGKTKRVFLGATVDPTTKKRVEKWQGKRKLISAGVVIDKLAEHAKRTQFRPVRKGRLQRS